MIMLKRIHPRMDADTLKLGVTYNIYINQMLPLRSNTHSQIF